MTIGESTYTVESGATASFDMGCEILGCTDATATNYNAEANTDDGSCEYVVAQGCIDETACNYDVDAVEDDASCTYAEAGFDCEGNCSNGGSLLVMTDSYGDGWNGNVLTINGSDYTIATGSSASVCVDPSGCYVMSWTEGGYSSETSWSFNGQEGSNGSIPENMGECTTGCSDATATNYNADADISDDTLCVYDLVQGCTDATACNFDATAEQDNGTCEYPEAGFDCEGNCASGTLVTVDGGSYPGEKSWTITSCDGSELASGGAPFAGCADLSGSYTIDLVDSYGDGWDGTVMTIGESTYTVESGATASFDMGCAILGCTDATATNYNAEANTDDGSCEYVLIVEGCTDMTASNYNDEATDDNGSCISWAEVAADLQAQLDAIVPEDGITQADVDAVQALLDAIVPEDGITQADVDAVQALLDAIVPEDGISQADVDAAYADGAASVTPEDGVSQADVDAVQALLDAVVPEDGITQADVDAVQALLDAIVPEDGVSQADVDAAYADGAASVTPEDGITQADVDAVQALLDAIVPEDGVSQADVDAVQALLDAVVPEDGVSQADVDAAVNAADLISAGIIADLQAQLDDALANSCAPIYVDIVEGWNILGYTLSHEQDVAATLSSIEVSIAIVKDNNANVYWPEFGFNGIGNFIPGQGYQIKTYDAVASYTWPNTNGERIEMSPTVPQWAANMEADVHPNDIRSLVKVVNMLGQEVNVQNQFKGEVVLYLYNDGTVEKKIVQ